MSHQKLHPFYVGNNLAKSWPILIILSLMISQLNCRKKLEQNLPPHLKSVASLHCEN